jgi:thioredoxin-related protein
MKILILIFFLFATAQVQAGDTTKTLLYNPKADAVKDIDKAIAKAKAEKKHVLIQAGGNWCVWCMRFNNYATMDKHIDSVLKANYVVYHLNWSPENENEVIFKRYDFPQRFGFPVFIILDADGKRIHTQNSAYLEAVKTYDRKKIIEFLQHWSPTALDPNSYKTK